MTLLVLDSGGLSRLAEPRLRSLRLIETLHQAGAWPPIVPAVVLAESLSGRQRTDAAVNRLLKSCTVVGEVSESLARRAGVLRALALRGSAVDALVVATAEPGGTVLTGDIDDLSALANCAVHVTVTRV